MSNEEIAETDQLVENSSDQTNRIDAEIRVSNYKEDIEHSLRCKSFCCSQILAERLSAAGLNKCWCCFDCCFDLVDKQLETCRNGHHGKMEENRVVHFFFMLFLYPWSLRLV